MTHSVLRFWGTSILHLAARRPDPGRSGSLQVFRLTRVRSVIWGKWTGVMADEAKNYITPAGFRRLQEELPRLWKVEGPALVAAVAGAAGNGDRSENGDYIYGKRRLREIDRRIRYLSKVLDGATVVDNSGKTQERVHF